jgi:hypothetical protein
VASSAHEQGSCAYSVQFQLCLLSALLELSRFGAASCMSDVGIDNRVTQREGNSVHCVWAHIRTLIFLLFLSLVVLSRLELPVWFCSLQRHPHSIRCDGSMIQTRVSMATSSLVDLVGSTCRRYVFQHLLQERQHVGRVWLASFEHPSLAVCFVTLTDISTDLETINPYSKTYLQAYTQPLERTYNLDKLLYRL